MNAPDRPAPPLPAEHRTRVLTLLAEVGIDTQSEYVAHNGVVRVKVARMNGMQWGNVRRSLTLEMARRDWMYGISRSEFLVEDADELTFRPPEAMR